MAVTKVEAAMQAGGLAVNDIVVIKEQSAVIAALVDSTGGSADTASTINDTTSSVKDDLATLAAKINAILAALKTHGLIASS